MIFPMGFGMQMPNTVNNEQLGDFDEEDTSNNQNPLALENFFNLMNSVFNLQPQKPNEAPDETCKLIAQPQKNLELNSIGDNKQWKILDKTQVDNVAIEKSLFDLLNSKNSNEIKNNDKLTQILPLNLNLENKNNSKILNESNLDKILQPVLQDNKNQELILSKLEFLPIEDKERILKSLLSIDSDNLNKPNLDKIDIDKILNEFKNSKTNEFNDKNIKNDTILNKNDFNTTLAKNQENIKSSQNPFPQFVIDDKNLQMTKNSSQLDKIDFDKNKDILNFLEASPILKDPELSKKFMDGESENQNNKDESHIEFTSFVGKNGEVFSHSDITKTNLTQPQANINHVMHKAIELSDQLKASQGGTAKFQIQDSQLGQISLQVDMKNKSSISISIQTEHEAVKKNIEDKIDILKQSLDSQKIALSEFKVTVLDKPTSAQSQWNQSNQGNQQEQIAQNWNQSSLFQNQFKQSGGDNSRQGFQLEDKTISNGFNKNYKNMQKNTVTNIQRGANGSIHVSA